MNEELEKRQLWVKFFFGNGEYVFHLKHPQMRELEDMNGVGIGAIYRRMATSAYYASDIVQILRLGLVGGGSGEVMGEEVKVTDRIAHDLVNRYQEGMTMTDKWSIAMACIAAAMIGVPIANESDTTLQDNEAA